MELTSRMKLARFQTFWIQIRKNKTLDESRKTGHLRDENDILLYKKYIADITIMLEYSNSSTRTASTVDNRVMVQRITYYQASL
ncbi:hypothetical protein Hanom_Chr07g00591631 [Helianthus anomalus]